MSITLRVPFGDLARQAAELDPEVSGALIRVARSGWYILGNEVTAFEAEFAAFCGAEACVGVASGADALYLALTALDVGPGDEVITVANACVYQVAAILQTGARPVFVDIDPATHTLDPALLEAAITPRTRVLLPVHLYGRTADMAAIWSIARLYDLKVVEDAAQAHGARYRSEPGALVGGGASAICCFSFYPSKNLGALGDGGALTTGDPDLAARLRRLRMYGWGEKYIAVEAGGRNSRLDELQAAVLRVKLRRLAAWNQARRERAAWYRELLAGLPLELPADDPGHVYHLFVVQCDNRDALRRHLLEAGVGCDVHYPVPAHVQPAYAALGYRQGALPHTERAATRVLSLPLFPELTRAEVEAVARSVRSFFGYLT
ncbi:MAG: DegT/DnrJ/EryC1/StrS family aminotransferase [Chloroflexaceae bacterium]